MSNQEKMINAIQEQQAHWVMFASKVMENSMKLFELNMRMSKESIDDSSQSIQHLLQLKAPEEAFALDAEKMQDRLNHMLSYAKEINEITSGLIAELNAELVDMAQTQFHELVEQSTKQPPKSAGNNQQPVDLMLTSIGNMSKGYEQWMNASKQFAEAVEKNLAAHNPTGTSGPAAPTKKKGAK